MPITFGNGISGLPYFRRWFITDRTGKSIEVTSQAVLQSIIDQMTPEEYERWKINYRFAPIQNRTNNNMYNGSLRDVQ